MKKWTALLISFVVLMLLAYYVMGFIVKSTLNKNINAIPKSSLLSLYLDKYQRGWFTSQSILRLKMHVPAQQTTDEQGMTKMNPPIDLDVDFPLIIKHGPVIFAENGVRFGIGQVTTHPETHYGLFINYLNRTILKYTLPSFEIRGKTLTDNSTIQVTWLGLSVLLSVSAHLNNIDGHLKMYGSNGSGNNTVYKIGEISNDFKFKRHQDWLWVGQISFNIPTIEARLGNQNLFEVAGFDFLLDSDITDGVLNYGSKLTLKKLTVTDKIVGPGVLKLSIKNLDPQAMAKINQQQLTMLNNSNLATLALLAEVPKLLSRGPILEISEMTLNLPEGKISGYLNLSIPKNGSNDPTQLIKTMRGEGRFVAPIVIVRTLITESMKSDLANKAQSPSRETVMITNSSSNSSPSTPDSNEQQAQIQVDKILQDLVNKGFLKIEESNYVLVFKLENQQLIVNGKPFNPGMLQ